MGVIRMILLMSVLICGLSECRIAAYGHSQTPRQILTSPPEKLFKRAEAYQAANQVDSALKYYVALSATYGREMEPEVKDMCAEAALRAGELYYSRSSFVAAFNSFMRAAEIGQDNKSYPLLAKAYKNLGNINATFNDNLQSMNCYKMGLDYARKGGDEDTEFKLLVNMSAVCAYDGAVHEAEKYYAELKKSRLKSPLLPYFTYLNGGLINSAKGDRDAALADYDSAYSFAMKRGLDAEYICGIYSEKGKAYSKFGDTVRAIENFRKCADYAGKERVAGMLAESYKMLGELYSGMGDTSGALRYTEAYHQLRDSLMREDDYSRMKGEHFAYEMERNYADISRLKQEVTEGEIRERSQRRVIIITSVLVLLFLAMACGLYAQKKKLQKAYGSIYRKNQELLKSDSYNRSLRENFERVALTQDADPQQVCGTDGVPDEDEDVRRQSSEKLSEDKKNAILAAIIHTLEHTDEIYNAEFSLDRLAELTSINTRYLSQVVNESMGGNFRSVLNEYRIREAQRRLSDVDRYGDLTIQGIANSVGYKSYPNFVSAFKRQTGLTPSQYQRTAKKDREAN